MQPCKLGQLNALCQKSEGAKEVVVFLHGFGANKEDLAPLANYINIGRPLDFFFLDAPIEVPVGFGMVGRAWYHLDMMKLNKAINDRDFKEFAHDVPEGLAPVTQMVKDAISELSNNYDSLYLAGFSQGSMVSANLTFSNPGLVQKLVLLSSAFINETKWEELADGAHLIPVFQSHGHSDAVLPFHEAKRLSEFFKKKDFPHQFVEFQGGHEIPPQVLTELNHFLKDGPRR